MIMADITISVIGECMVELQKSGELYNPNFGGDTLNTALYLARLVNGKNISINYVTGIGEDIFSQKMVKAWQAENINTDLVHTSATKNAGLYVIDTDSDGERSFHYWRSDSAARYWLLDVSVPDLVSKLSQSQWIYLSGISLAILPKQALEILFDVLHQCHRQGTKIAFDNNYRANLWSSREEAQSAYRRILKMTDLAFLTFDDEQALFGDASESQSIERAQAMGIDEIVIKRGSNACFVVKDDQLHEVPARHISNIIDTTAAGDSFSAGYMASRFIECDVLKAAAMGHLLAGTVIQYPGAIIPLDVMPQLNN